MSLLEEYSTEYTILLVEESDDEYGSTVTKYVDGMTFIGQLAFKSDSIMSVSEALGLMTNYRLIIPKGVKLEFHDIVKRNSDGKVFRVKSNSANVYTPSSSGLDLSYVELEEWSLKDNYEGDNES